MRERSPFVVPDRPMGSVRDAVIAGLRSRILSLERHVTWRGPGEDASTSEGKDLSHSLPRSRWELGCPASDALLPAGLEPGALHEIKGAPSAAHGASAADWMAGIGFAARLAVRRIDALAGSARGMNARPWVLWCWPRSLAAEFGTPSFAGFARLGLDPSRLLIVETARASDTLNAIEESLRAQSLALVIGVLNEAGLTPARRLSLAAGEAATPCLLVTHPASEPAAATATRWRIRRQPSARHDFDSRASGAARFSIALERCKARPESAAQPALLVEWSDETRRFDMASVVADLPAQTHGARGGAIGPTVRSY